MKTLKHKKHKKDVRRKIHRQLIGAAVESISTGVRNPSIMKYLLTTI